MACLALLVLSPLFIFAAVGIMVSSPGPILYRARRVGLYGAPFWLYKFRSMYVSGRAAGCAETQPASRITGANDSRVFRFGALLRRLKIDELPQLLYIVRGEMAFVGPRPEDPWIVEHHYSAEDWETLHVFPGLTSPGTIYYYLHAEQFVDSADPENSYIHGPLKTKLAIDRMYLRRASLSADLKILGRTAGILFGAFLGREQFVAVPETTLLNNRK